MRVQSIRVCLKIATLTCIGGLCCGGPWCCGGPPWCCIWCGGGPWCCCMWCGGPGGGPRIWWCGPPGPCIIMRPGGPFGPGPFGPPKKSKKIGNVWNKRWKTVTLLWIKTWVDWQTLIDMRGLAETTQKPVVSSEKCLVVPPGCGPGGPPGCGPLPIPGLLGPGGVDRVLDWLSNWFSAWWQ